MPPEHASLVATRTAPADAARYGPASMIEPHPSIPSAWVASADGRMGRPIVGVIGALHGNEPAGLRAIERVLDDPRGFASRLREGTVVFVHGNPRATEQGRRFTESGADLNRLFGYAFLETLAREAWTYEHHRALELRPLLAELDALVDLHSASQPAPPFAVCDGTDDGIELARKTGCHVCFGFDGPGMLMSHVSIGALVARGKPALSVECGQHDAPETADAAYDVMTRFLGALGVTDHPPAGTPGPTYELFARVVKPTTGFRLARDFSSFDRLESGTVLGHGDGVTIAVDEEVYLLLPTPKAERGDDIVYLAREVR